MYKRGGVWWTCIRYGGKKIQRSLETADKKLAQAIEAKIKTEIVEGKYFEKLTGNSKTFTDMMEKFMKEHAPSVSISMQRSYSASLKHLIPFFGTSKLSSISPKMISEYKVLRKSEEAKPATVNRELAMLSKAFNLAVKEWEWIKDNPVSKVPKEKEGNDRDRWLADDEKKRLLNVSPPWLRNIIIFDLHTGLRQGELLSLQWNRVNLLRRTIIIQETKSGKPRTIPLNQVAFDILTEKSKIRNIKNDLVFSSGVGNKIDRHNLRRAFNIAIEKAGLRDFHFHDLRHTFATRLAQKGIDIYKISKLLGHHDIRMTQRYSHHCPDSLRDGVQILEADYNLTTLEEKREVANA
ncbi:MAG: site-specific integrase [Candidatus Brocadia sp. AMX2]|uniref:Integrase n=1 Tax=Candidatus Brocadia sinica JPN1 TaxID=1197129 RepID=A0ABQ0K289_9BACT|nr:site-specific integrase [Candidatus Brocadia sinica]KAA0244002.1 MAG: site-specific integrase [Candidatus Brocadia sp. AMX2]MBC6932533.1 site-specific integrase [Candidatus Brocadia sp.]MBL1168066.1 site-specific integrase [Candidatus Brocadia sp. AMX1]NOG42647.1 tyrosine-type recombinase/integrase [Planctomycetota bacterium]KXK30792.1 MAG: site-specific tyrosine recombinase [Candidatus Brocadia sinica]